MSSVVKIPVGVEYPSSILHSFIKASAGIRCQDMERGSFDALRYGPIHGAFENRFVIGIHAEHEAAVDHNAQFMQPSHGSAVVTMKVLRLPLVSQVADVRGFEAHKETPQPAIHSLFQYARLQHRIHSACSLPKPAHTAHAVEKCRRKIWISQQMIIEKVQVPPRQALDLGKCGVHCLCIKRSPTREKRLLVTKIADIGASPRNDDRIWDQIKMPLNQITSYRRRVQQRA